MGLDLNPLNFPPGCGPGHLGGVSTRLPLGPGTPPGADPPGPCTPQEQTPPGAGPPCMACWDSTHPPCKARWDTTCNACWDSTPLLTESQTNVKTLPCPNFVAGGKHGPAKRTSADVLLKIQRKEKCIPRSHTHLVQ